MTTCEARIGWTLRPQGWGQTPVYCGQSVGLRALRDAAGRTRRYCVRDGHRYSVVRRYGEWLPEQDDPITAAKAWTEAELREAWGDR